jgi:hypothetical protein
MKAIQRYIGLYAILAITFCLAGCQALQDKNGDGKPDLILPQMEVDFKIGG